MSQGHVLQAITCGQYRRLSRLLQDHPHLIHASIADEAAPLIIAARCGRLDMVKMLLDMGAHSGCTDPQDGTSPLYWAACCGFANVASLLLQRGAPATAKDVEGWNALMAAARNGHSRVVKLLLQNPEVRAAVDDTNGQGQSALWMACSRGHADVARLLLERGGADPDVVDGEEGRTCKQAAQERGWSLQENRGRRQCVEAIERVEAKRVFGRYLRPYLLGKARTIADCLEQQAATQPSGVQDRLESGMASGAAGSSSHSRSAAIVPACLRRRVERGRRLPRVTVRQDGLAGAVTEQVVRGLGADMFKELVIMLGAAEESEQQPAAGSRTTLSFWRVSAIAGASWWLRTEG